MSKKHYHPPSLNRDHARPRTAPAPSDEAVEARLTELISPATYALADHYRSLGLRWRVLTLPVMVALVLAIIWRQVASVSDAARLLFGERLLWTPPTRVSQQALSQRLGSMPAQLFSAVLHQVLPKLLERSRQRHRSRPEVVRRALTHIAGLWVVDATTLEAVFKKVGALRDADGTVLGGQASGSARSAEQAVCRVVVRRGRQCQREELLDRLRAMLPAGTLLAIDKGFYAFPFFDWFTEHGSYLVTRARTASAFAIGRALVDTPTVRDRVIRQGQYRSNPCWHPVRLVEVCGRALARLPHQCAQPDGALHRGCGRPLWSPLAHRRGFLAGDTPPGAGVSVDGIL